MTTRWSERTGDAHRDGNLEGKATCENSGDDDVLEEEEQSQRRRHQGPAKARDAVAQTADDALSFVRRIPLAEAEIPQQRPPVRTNLEAPRLLSTDRRAARVSDIIATTRGMSTQVEIRGVLGILRGTLSL